MGKAKRVDNAILNVMMNNAGIWLTTKEIGWIMREMYDFTANGKVLCRRIIGLEYISPEFLQGGRVERLKLEKAESQWLKCKYRYRWVIDG